MKDDLEFIRLQATAHPKTCSRCGQNGDQILRTLDFAVLEKLVLARWLSEHTCPGTLSEVCKVQDIADCIYNPYECILEWVRIEAEERGEEALKE